MMVSVIIPCRNEEESILSVLQSLLAQEINELELEVIISDGESEDKTLEVIRSFLQKFANKNIDLRVLTNKKRNIPCALNLAVSESRGDYIIRIDAHSKFEKNYIADIINGIRENNADVVGPSIKNYSDNEGEFANSVICILNHPLGNGGTLSRNKISKPKLVKHTVMSCYKRHVWKSIGGYDETMLSNEDFEFDFRANIAGFSIFSLPVPNYFMKVRSNIKEFAIQRFRYGFWKYKVYRKHPSSLHLRQLIPILAFFMAVTGMFFPVFLVIQLAGLVLVAEIIRLSAKNKVSRSSLFLVLCINYYVWSAGFLWSAFQDILFSRSKIK